MVVVLNSDLSQDKRKKLLETIKNWLGDLKISKEESWGQKALAYPIKHEQIGYFHWMTLESEKGISTDFEKRLLSQDSVIRHLLVRRK